MSENFHLNWEDKGYAFPVTVEVSDVAIRVYDFINTEYGDSGFGNRVAENILKHGANTYLDVGTDYNLYMTIDLGARKTLTVQEREILWELYSEGREKTGERNKFLVFKLPLARMVLKIRGLTRI